MIAAVTGANGFIGRHLCQTLATQGHEVRSIVRADFAADRLRQIIDGADVVIHVAGATRAPTVKRLRDSNVELTRRTLAASAAAGVSRFVYVSSQAAAGPASARNRPTIEDDPAAPVEAYGRSKRDAELLVEQSGLPSVIIRPAAVYGPGDRDFRAMFKLASRGMAIHPGNRAQWISIIHVRDCIDGIVRALSSERAVGRSYFLANDEPVQWRTLFDLVGESASANRFIDLQLPMPLVRAGALFGDLAARVTGHAGLLTTEKVKLGRAPFWICSNERARRELGFRPRVALQAGLAETYRWYLENGGL